MEHPVLPGAFFVGVKLLFVVKQRVKLNRHPVK